MGLLHYRFLGLLSIGSLVLLLACQPTSQTIRGKGGQDTQVHYLEIVTKSVDEQLKVLEQVHGLSFGSAVEDLGNARVAETPGGTLVGVRTPLADHEQPIIRIYFEVDDITKAVQVAEAAGAVIAYPPTRQGETGTWAIYILDGIQYGLWQK